MFTECVESAQARCYSSTAFNGVNISGSVRQSVFRGQLLPIRKAEALWLTNLSMLNTLGSDNDVADQDNRRDVSEIFNVARHFLRVRSEGLLERTLEYTLDVAQTDVNRRRARGATGDCLSPPNSHCRPRPFASSRCARAGPEAARSEKRRVGKGCVSEGITGWS